MECDTLKEMLKSNDRQSILVVDGFIRGAYVDNITVIDCLKNFFQNEFSVTMDGKYEFEVLENLRNFILWEL